MSKKRPREDDEDKETLEVMNELFKKSKKTKAELTMKERKNNAAKLVGTARTKYVAGNAEAAMAKLKESLKMWPHAPEAYQLMGLIAQEKGDENTALSLWLLQAHFDRKKVSLWQDLYHLAMKLNRKKESIYCLAKIERIVDSQVAREGDKASEAAKKKQDDVRKHRLQLLEEIDEVRLVEDGYRKILRGNPFDVEAVNNLARYYVKQIRPENALAVVERFLTRCLEETDKAPLKDPNFLCSCNIAIELNLDKGNFTRAKELVERIMALQGVHKLNDVHPDISIKYCIAQVYLSCTEEALDSFNAIKAEIDPRDFGDLFFDFSQALMKCGHSEAALKMLEDLVRTGFTLPIVVFAIAKCNIQMANEASSHPDLQRMHRANAEKQFRAVLQLSPSHTETRSCLAGLILDLGGDINEALQLLDYNSIPEWSPEESLIIALNRMELLKKLQGRGREASYIARSVLAAVGRAPPELMDPTATSRRAGRTRFALLTKTQSTQVMRASTLIHNMEGQTGNAMQAVAQLPLSEEKAPIAAAARSAIAEKVRRLNEAPEKTVRTVSGMSEEESKLSAEMEVAYFLESSEILQKAYTLALPDEAGDESEAEAEVEVEESAEEDEEDEAQPRQKYSVLVKDLMDKYANEDVDGEGDEEFEEAKKEGDLEELLKDQRMTWNSDTIRQVLQTGDFEASGLWTLLRDLILEVTADEDPSMQLARSLIPVLHGAVVNKYKLFSHEQVVLTRQFVVAISFALGDFKYAYGHVRRLAGDRAYHTNHFWNVLNALLLFQGSKVDLRSLMDILRSHRGMTDCHPLFMILGNCIAMRHGSTKLSLGPFLQARKLKPDDPLASFMLSLLYLRLVTPRGVANRHYTFLHGLGYIDQYRRLRMSEDHELLSEVEYNFGRFHHQLAINHVAAHHYQRVLDLYDEGKVPPEKSLHREAAYNLHLILKGSSNHRAAHQLLQKYIVVE